VDGVWYFAYGANMSRAVLARRGVTPSSSEAATLRGYRHRFSHEGLIPIEPAFANIEAAPDDAAAITHGVLHRLTADDLAHLDRIEGAEYLHVDVAVQGARSGAVTARAYLNPHPVQGKVPSRRYLACLCAGAREHALPADYIAQLEAHPSRHWFLVSDVANLLAGTAERVRRMGFRPERARLARRGRTGRSDDAREGVDT
jgi:gamma-glutamylcyclotransferase